MANDTSGRTPRNRPPLARLGRAASVGAVIILFLGGLVGFANAGTDAPAWQEEAMGVAAPQIGDRGVYALSQADGASHKATIVRRIAFAWQKPETIRDPLGIDHPAEHPVD